MLVISALHAMVFSTCMGQSDMRVCSMFMSTMRAYMGSIVSSSLSCLQLTALMCCGVDLYGDTNSEGLQAGYHAVHESVYHEGLPR